ncbi:MAG: hypothetical protein NW224_15445 [Leptolyngbyaceae cyanobacterium bins.302]|nr:hypothetical protein [Leptolyngbyaceae cyanobacterium bins.302]
MTIVPNTFKFALGLTTLVGLLPLSAGAIAQHPEQHAKQSISAAQPKQIGAKIAQFLQQAGGSYTKVSETVWKVPYEGKSLANFDVMVITVPEADLVVSGVVVAEKKQLKLSQDLLYKLLKFNNSADRVKVGIDDDGDLFIRIETSGRTLDLEQFKADTEQLAAATDELHRQIKSSLVP